MHRIFTELQAQVTYHPDNTVDPVARQNLKMTLGINDDQAPVNRGSATFWLDGEAIHPGMRQQRPHHGPGATLTLPSPPF
ncbi:hypothetical protein KB20921_08940 [Edwardsiella ictaluri]|nr:Uncharacterised protein [Edwardsiella ictaluri]BEH98173.1 hypothetical protein KH20906_09010 [Edwardsiella ictaluri]BEI01633.1 hypothetical protein KB20921_08940 [Edwardsiella ictaluri]BEI05102.1 hypothetical protein KH201010_08880 [Edwardsiella ictaluri]BEI08557.1 hypothetical protein STU22726_08880 [Edwardsiella ictaluri]